MSSPYILHNSGLYRVAGVRDVARLVSSLLWKWIYRLGLGKNQVIQWLESLVSPNDRTAGIGLISDEMKKEIAQIVTKTGISMGDLVRYIIEEMDDPPPGYRWRKDKETGDLRLVKHSYREPEKAIHWGKKFEGRVFIGVWWGTNKPSGSYNKKLQAILRRLNGGVFFKEKVGEYTDYYGYGIVPMGSEGGAGNRIKEIAEQVKLEGEGEYRLSAASLQALAERRKLTPQDIITISGIFKSVKFNWELNLHEILNGRSKDNRINEGVKKALVDYSRNIS